MQTTAETRLAAWRRMALWLTAAIALIDAGFIFLVAYAKPLLATSVDGPLSLGLLLGAIAVFAGWAISAAYVLWANHANPEDVVR